MKHLLWVMIPMTIVSVEQVIQSPSCQIIDSLKSRFVCAKNIHWRQNKKGWDANFSRGDQTMTACFDQKGNLLKTQTVIAIEDLPLTIRCSIRKNYTRYSIVSASTLDSAGFSSYKIKLKNDRTTVDINATKWGELTELSTKP